MFELSAEVACKNITLVNNFSKWQFKNDSHVKYGLPIPNNSKLKELCLILPHIHPTLVIPVRFSKFIEKLTDRMYPYYFVFAILSFGIKRIKASRTPQDKALETMYAQKSLELMKLDKSFDPLIVWACCFVLGYASDTNDLKSNDQALDIATRNVKITRLYQLDINSKTEDIIQKYTEDELEFRRRVWWIYYIYISGNYLFNGNFITFEQRDMVVNYPKNDFKWKFGGDIGECTNKELKLLNYKANYGSESDFPQDYHYLVLNITSLYNNIVIFVTKRWRKDRLNEDQTNLRLVLYINKLQKFKNEIDKIFEEKSPQTHEIYNRHKGTIKLILDTEDYLFDINSKTEDIIQKYTEDELEFRRRVWWIYYIYISGNYLFNGNFITFEQRDMVVNYPKNDFKWKFGGDIGECTNKELKLLNYKANYGSESDFPQDYHYLVLNITSLYNNIVIFVTKRWRKDRLNEDQTNLRLVLYINKLQKFKNEIDKIFEEKSPQTHEIYNRHKGTIKLILDTEDYLFGYYIKTIYYNTLIYLYQSELVRDFDIKLHPGRVKAAKLQCINASVEQMNLIESYIKYVPDNYQEHSSIFWTVNASITFANFFFISDPDIKEKYAGFYDRMISVYNSFGESSEVILSLNLFIKYIIDVKAKANEQNKKLKHLHKHMIPFGVCESDIDPWIVPKYGSPFHLQCCGKGNFSILDIGGYLEEKITSADIFEQDDHTDAYQKVIKSPIIETNMNKKDTNKQLGKTNEYMLNFGEIPVIKKSAPLNSTESMDFFMSFLANAKQESPQTKEKPGETSKIIQIKPSSEETSKYQYDYRNTTGKESENINSNNRNKKIKHEKMDIKNLLNN
ncbi:hypothetical protein BB558_001720 [Smittium angustum]|uniref:Transcription factor domain-containing protein n=1 Tax=Smittium angustum TaxID=133377 RepID=A0A2U1JAL6_SMIAN|nr:hypothetical protein BB558_001720 [Smittium angustum]